jgi:hypothetical protein
LKIKTKTKKMSKNISLTHIMSFTINAYSNFESGRQEEQKMYEIVVRDTMKAVTTERGYIQAVIAKKARLAPTKLSVIAVPS